MKLQNSFRDYTAESSLFVRRALVAFLGILLLTGILVANLYNVQIVRYTDYQTRSNENRIKLVPIRQAAALSMTVTARRWR
nr:penicillin-binding protein 2 (PBP-2) [Raoultella sp. NCTC 9187]